LIYFLRAFRYRFEVVAALCRAYVAGDSVFGLGRAYSREYMRAMRGGSKQARPSHYRAHDNERGRCCPLPG
jgi:hypothetical protein